MKKKTLFLIFLLLFFLITLSFVVWDLSGRESTFTPSNSQEHSQGTNNADISDNPVNKETTKTQAKQNKGVNTNQKNDFLSVAEFTENNIGSTILGRPTDKSIALNIIASKGMEAYVEYGTAPAIYSQKTSIFASVDGDPIVVDIENLEPDTEYYYRVSYRKWGGEFIAGKVYSFHTARESGSTFIFAVQGDSHPERIGIMYNPELYKITMNNVLLDHPDFYFTIGDDFSIDNLIQKDTLNQELVDRIYLNQRNYLGIIGSSVPLFLVNGNHEQAAMYLLDGTLNNAAVLAAKSRIKNYALPTPDDFYSGDMEEVEFVGFLRDYYAFEWGDALFVVIDPYWHSDVSVDNIPGNDHIDTKRDMWNITLGDEQYQWFKKTLEESDATYKFVFTHHVLGTGRGGIENAKLYEWGGYGRNGLWEFDEKRPNWELPIHQLMVENNVTIFFQGHDHLFAYQKLDGIIYQTLPNPADDTYNAFNKDAYKTGDTLPNSGYMRITVSPERVNVEYVRSFLPGDGTNGEIAYNYEVLS
ncbi:MAG: PhoD-like phosphatase [Candidatus Methanofastidiosum methylothiophilum]|uniref:PhoD-like phosphatase n=1 Tax=Candidatus Methanofastidiosum methylothiophilum TaxID=1705564 RepID=A0A150J4M0_9EURY|nr:MAG: PhoD-like phosphatase [Candidatus Methanofastidiosum methylthiophilus]